MGAETPPKGKNINRKYRQLLVSMAPMEELALNVLRLEGRRREWMDMMLNLQRKKRKHSQGSLYLKFLKNWKPIEAKMVREVELKERRFWE